MRIVDAEIEYLEILREIKIRNARNNFWEYCKLMSPSFYRDDKRYLKSICDTLQALYEGRLYNKGSKVNKFMLNMPPRFGKSRTVALFCQWILGVNPNESIISATYNEKLSYKMSRAVRDGIIKTKVIDDDIVYSDIFPNSRLKRGDASVQSWSLEGSHFSYLATSFNGTITGLGGRVGIIDDSIKTHEEALNDDYLDSQWEWYLNTYLSRLEEGNIQIIIMTRWSDKDICGRILENEADKWYRIVFEACNDDGVMLDETVMSKATYESRKKVVEKSQSQIAKLIFNANYHQKIINIDNVLYKNIRTYKVVIRNNRYYIEVEGVPMHYADKDKVDGYDDMFDEVWCYYDIADRGKDYLCGIFAGVIEGKAYVLDVHYTDEHFEITEIESAEKIYRNNVSVVRMESNSGARAWGLSVKKLLNSKWRASCDFQYFHQKKNKEARILSNVTYVINNIYMPYDWSNRWPMFYEHLMNYQRNANNKYDDAPDALTGLSEMLRRVDYEDDEVANTEIKQKIRLTAKRI